VISFKELMRYHYKRETSGAIIAEIKGLNGFPLNKSEGKSDVDVKGKI